MEDSPFVDSIPSFIEGMKEDIAQLFSSQRSQISQTLEEESQQMKKMKSKNNKSHNTTPYQQQSTDVSSFPGKFVSITSHLSLFCPHIMYISHSHVN